jgi:3-oxoacyl-[acyl-carrier protein] reductase
MFDVTLNHKVALVTGVDDNLGAKICEKLAKAGAEVWIHRFNEEDAENLQEKILSFGGAAYVITNSLHTPEAVRSVVSKIIEKSCKIDILVNHAEKVAIESIDLLTTEKWLDTFETNLDVPFLCCQEILPFMLQKGDGTIINISSRSAETGELGPHYAATKSALESFTRGLSREFKGRGIKVKVVCPPISLHDKRLATYEKARIIEAMANKALLLCSPYLDYDVNELSNDNEVLKN